MRNLLMIGAFALMATFALTQQAQAWVPGGGGGGKVSSRAEFIFINVNPVIADNGNGLAVLVRPISDPLPANFAELRDRSVFIAPGKSFSTGSLKNGQFEVFVIDSDGLVAAADATPAAVPDPAEAFGINTFTLNGVNQTIQVSDGGFGPPPAPVIAP